MSLLSVSGCTPLTGETAGQYDDDSTMTILAKAKWVTDQAHLTGLDVATMASALVVELTGAIRTAMAAMLISH